MWKLALAVHLTLGTFLAALLVWLVLMLGTFEESGFWLVSLTVVLGYIMALPVSARVVRRASGDTDQPSDNRFTRA